MAQRFSGRPVKPKTPFGHEKLTVEGHGEIDPSEPTFTLPSSTSVVLYMGIGVGLDDSHGQDIASGKGMPATAPTTWDAHNHEYDTDPGGTQTAATGHQKVYRAGEKCPNLKLFPYNHPAMAAIAIDTTKSYHLSYDATLPNKFEYLKDIAAANAGKQIHWACCTVRR